MMHKYQAAVKELGWDVKRSTFKMTDPARQGYSVSHPTDKSIRMEGYTNANGFVTEGIVYGPKRSYTFALDRGESIPTPDEALQAQQ